jgi:hypothetical protein
MSRDLSVISSEQPALDETSDWVARRDGWEAIRCDGAVTIERRSRRPTQTGFIINEPARIEAEDLPPELAAAVVVPRWETEINVPATASDVIWRMALRLGRHVADDSQGVLFDPQEDEILWPRSKHRRVSPRSAGESASTLDLEWAIPPEGFTDRLPADLLALLRRSLPEGLPRRFGSYEPLQGRLDDDGDAGFIAAWRTEQAQQMGSLFWKGRTPAPSGSLFFPSAWAGGQGGIAAGCLSMDLDGAALDDPRWRELAMDILDEMAALSGAFYARATFQARSPDWNTVAVIGTNPPSITPRSEWLGLPDTPAWLTWLGRQYADAIVDSLPADLCHRARHGMVVRLSGDPRTQLELVPWADRFPADYCRQRDPRPPERERYIEHINDPLRVAPRFPSGLT